MPYLRNVTNDRLVMFVKIDTRPDFRILKLNTPIIHANMADEFLHLIVENLSAPPYHLILDMEEVSDMEPPVPEKVPKMQSFALEKGYSFFMEGVHGKVADKLNNLPGFNKANTVSTLAEAIDMVMMEKMERELLNGEE